MSQIDKIPTLELSVRDVVADSMQFGSQIAERDDSSELESYTTYREQKYGVNSLDDTADWESDEDSTRPNVCEPIAIPTRPKKIVRSSYSTAVKQRILRNWEGVITSVCDDYFEARLHDMTGKVDDEIVEIGFDEINEDEIDLVESGAVFTSRFSLTSNHQEQFNLRQR